MARASSRNFTESASFSGRDGTRGSKKVIGMDKLHWPIPRQRQLLYHGCVGKAAMKFENTKTHENAQKCNV